jgi:uncharacterized protein involved in exopolysaccharide biosynthesis
MSTETELRPPRSRTLPELDVEQDVDLRKYWRRLKARWWLPLAGIVLGAFIGYLVAQGSGKVYKAQALIYLGNPLSTGGASLTSLSANPRFVNASVHSEEAIREAARASGLAPSALRGHISSAAVQGVAVLGTNANKGPQTLATITVTNSKGLRAAAAANALANIVISQVSRYPSTKIRTYKTQLTSNKRELKTVTERIANLNKAFTAKNSDVVERMLLVSQIDNSEQRRGSLLTQQSVVQQQLTQAEDIESPRIVDRALPVETTARSTRNSALVGAFIGLILGVLAALLADGVAARWRPRPA